jgi:hypothetical protein
LIEEATIEEITMEDPTKVENFPSLRSKEEITEVETYSFTIFADVIATVLIVAVDKIPTFTFRDDMTALDTYSFTTLLEVALTKNELM